MQCPNPKTARIFQPDEMKVRKVASHWTLKTLLAQDGIFFLKDIVTLLDVPSPRIKKRAKAVAEKGQLPWAEMGVRKVWTHWIVRMKVFGPYYRRYLQPPARPVNPNWDANVLLGQKGIFYLTKVCRKLPLKADVFRHWVRKTPQSRKTIGVWRDAKSKRYLVDMAIFSPWMKALWRQKLDWK